MVRERSGAEMPVVTPSRASTEIVNAVPYGVSLRSVICRKLSSSQRVSVRQRQMRQRPSLVMKLTASGVANWAAIVRSPSFSRSAASTTTTNFPWRMSSIASSIVAKALRSSICMAAIVAWPVRRSLIAGPHETLDVLREHVHLEIDLATGVQVAQRRDLQRVWHQCDDEGAVLAEFRHGEGDALDGDRAFLDDVPAKLFAGLDQDATLTAAVLDRGDDADAVHVALHVMATQRLA